jgi:hypothetical protein
MPDLGNKVAIVSISIHNRDCAHRDLTGALILVTIIQP